MATAATANTDQATAKTEAAATDTSAKPADKAADKSTGTTDAKADDKPAEAAVVEKTYTQAEHDRLVAKAKRDSDKAAADAAAAAKLSEDERKDKEISDLKTSIQMRDAKDAFVDELTKAGAKSPGLMFNSVKGDLEFDDKGNVKNLNEIMTDLKAEFPEQFGIEKPTDPIDGGAGGKGKGGEKLTKEMIAKMSPAEINARWEEVKAVMAAK